MYLGNIRSTWLSLVPFAVKFLKFSKIVVLIQLSTMSCRCWLLPFFMTGRTIETFSVLRTNFVEFLWYLWIFWEDFKFFWLMHTYFNKQLSLNCSINPLFKLKHIESHQVTKIFSQNMKFIKMTSFQLYIDCQIIKLTFII